jgi:hypothetical protein
MLIYELVSLVTLSHTHSHYLTHYRLLQTCKFSLLLVSHLSCLSKHFYFSSSIHHTFPPLVHLLIVIVVLCTDS